VSQVAGVTLPPIRRTTTLAHEACRRFAAQANLIQAENMASVGQLTAGIAHEIKNPLNFVNKFAALSAELIDDLRAVLAPQRLEKTSAQMPRTCWRFSRAIRKRFVLHGSMTDIFTAPDDPAERLKWAKGLLREFSSPRSRGAASAAEIRAMARSIISELDPSVQAKPNRTHRDPADTVDYVHNLHPPILLQ
jgi:signal transduction histidine kinase